MSQTVTQERLRKYRALRREIEVLEQRESRKIVSDTVTGSQLCLPFAETTFRISGVAKPSRQLRTRRYKAASECREIEGFIRNIPDPHIRTLITLRYLDGLPWAKVAKAAGGRNNEDSVRMAVSRFLGRS